MALKVTKAVTKHGRYYASGEVLDNPTAVETSIGRLYKWVHVDVDRYSTMTKTELVEVAQLRGLDTSGLRKQDLIELLDG